MRLSEELLPIREDVSLAPFTTFKIGGSARYFFQAKSEKDLIRAVSAARVAKLPFLILGGGSNLLVSDRGVDGLAIKNQISSIEMQNGNIVVGAGALLGKVVGESVEAGLTGLGWAAGIPGTIGGALRGNAGAYGCRISELVREVEILDEAGAVRTLPPGECGFGYRESVFKHRPWVIISAKLKLLRGNRREIEERVAEILAARRRGLPSLPSAGCIFKNLEASSLGPEAEEQIPEEKIKGGMVSAGHLIEQCGLKGRRVGGAQISEKHANFIVNVGGAKAADVVALIELCKESARDKFGIDLEEEIRYLGFSQRAPVNSPPALARTHR
jgi:UDP-N-acetylmuramate dehydrogenase